MIPESTQHRISTSQTLVKDRDRARSKIQSQINEFYANGGKIQAIETGVTSYVTKATGVMNRKEVVDNFRKVLTGDLG